MAVLTLCALLLACPRAGSVADEFGEHLARLAAPRAAERAAAERWLQAHLVLERYPELAECALAGDAEVRARLARVLGSDPRHLGLALALCAEPEESLATLGRESVRAGVARAAPRLGEAPVRDGLESLLRRAASEGPPEALSLAPQRSLGELLEELTLALELPVGLTLDARLATNTLRRDDGPARAPWNELLLRLANGLGLTLESHGWPSGRIQDLPEGVFLRFTPRGEPLRSGVELVSEWLITLALPGDEGARVRAAKNLAATGFAPGLAWMDELLRARADQAAREGLLWAAARGQVAPSLLAPEVLGPLLLEAEAGGPRSGRILAALARVGCYGGAGSALAPQLLADFEASSARGRWIRLFLLARNGCAAPELEGRLHDLLAADGTPPALRLQALLTRASLGSAGAPTPVVAGLAELFRLPLDGVELERLGRALAVLTLAPPFPDPARIPSGWSASERRALRQAWLWNGRTEIVAAHLGTELRGESATLAARGEALAQELGPWLARGAGASLVEPTLVAAKASAPALAAALDRVRLLLGLVPAEQVPALLAGLGFTLGSGGSDPALLAALGGYPERLEIEARARAELLRALETAVHENRPAAEVERLLACVERMAQGLYAAGRDEDADKDVVAPVRQLLQRAKKTLARRIEPQAWPSRPYPLERDVARSMARFEVPASL